MVLFVAAGDASCGNVVLIWADAATSAWYKQNLIVLHPSCSKYSLVLYDVSLGHMDASHKARFCAMPFQAAKIHDQDVEDADHGNQDGAEDIIQRSVP